MKKNTNWIYDLSFILLGVALFLTGIALHIHGTAITNQQKQLEIYEQRIEEIEKENSDLKSKIDEVSNNIYFEDPQETEKINQALYDEGYIRDDIPLDTDTQLLLRAATDEFDIPYELALAVIWQETNYQNITGDSGNASGYMQIWEYWNKDQMERIGASDLMNPIDNFRTGCSLLHDSYENSGSYYDALSIYNTGSSGWSSYADAVMAKWESLDI